VHGNRGSTSIRMPHDVVAAGHSGDLEIMPFKGANNARSRDRRQGRHSGCDRDRQLPRSAEFLNQTGQRLPEVFKSSFFGVALTVCPQARTELSVRTPHAVFVLFYDDRYGHGAELSHLRRILGTVVEGSISTECETALRSSAKSLRSTAATLASRR